MAESWVLRKAETRAVSLAGHLEYSTAVSLVCHSVQTKAVHLVAMTVTKKVPNWVQSLVDYWARSSGFRLAQRLVVQMVTATV